MNSVNNYQKARDSESDRGPFGARPGRIPKYMLISGVTSVLLLVYSVSGWPAVYLTGKLLLNPDNRLAALSSSFINFIYTPHSWVMVRNRWYYEYMSGAARAADPRLALPAWDEMQKALDDK